jgi:hypothetical protein
MPKALSRLRGHSRTLAQPNIVTPISERDNALGHAGDIDHTFVFVESNDAQDRVTREIVAPKVDIVFYLSYSNDFPVGDEKPRLRHHRRQSPRTVLSGNEPRSPDQVRDFAKRSRREEVEPARGSRERS